MEWTFDILTLQASFVKRQQQHGMKKASFVCPQQDDTWGSRRISAFKQSFSLNYKQKETSTDFQSQLFSLSAALSRSLSFPLPVSVL